MYIKKKLLKIKYYLNLLIEQDLLHFLVYITLNNSNNLKSISQKPINNNNELHLIVESHKFNLNAVALNLMANFRRTVYKLR